MKELTTDNIHLSLEHTPHYIRLSKSRIAKVVLTLYEYCYVEFYSFCKRNKFSILDNCVVP